MVAHPTRPPPGYAIAGLLLPRLIAAIFLLALVSWSVQWRGLVGSEGILPLAQMMENIQSVEDRDQSSLFWRVPSIFHWQAHDGFIQFVIGLGMVFAALIIAGLAQGPLLLALWFIYLSLVVTGNVFMGFQWDSLLLEAGLLAALLAPWRAFSPFQALRPPPRAAILLFHWLLFRLMFLSGLVKWTGGDPAWRDFTALFHHYETQPLPNALSWFAHHLPSSLHQSGCVFMHVVELILPFAVFAGRRGRRVAALGFTLLMTAVLLTGNYTYFNLLTLVLCLSLLDDACWPLRLRRLFLTRPVSHSSPSLWRQPREWPSLAFSFPALLFTLTAADAFLHGRISGLQRLLPAPLHALHDSVSPLRSFNAYGLFQSMTRQRPEILLEVSDDGLFWLPLQFKWKPGDLSRRPSQAAPHQPRLDWQMWFAALSPGFLPERDSHPASPTFWFGQFCTRLLQHKQPVWDLLEPPPIPVESVTHIRARLARYRFTTPEQRSQTGQWWTSEPLGSFSPPLSLPASP
jgi:lipase maturation factor 1